MERNVDSLLTKAKNKFLLSNAISGRAKQIHEGSLPYIDNFDPTNPIITAIREIASDKIKIKMTTAASKKPQEVKIVDEESTSALKRLAKDSKPAKKPKEKKK